MHREEHYYNVNGIQLHTVEQRDKKSTVILFLHGFPESSYGWKAQLPFFAAQGFRAIAVDQRGYSLSSKPATVKSYHITNLVEDIKCLVDKLTKEKIILVGHDWGGGVAWLFAQLHPEKLQKLVILNMPHPYAIKKILFSRVSQMARSWYAGFFQIPVLPELLLRRFNYWLMKNSMKRSSKKGTFTIADFEKYKEAWRQPKALTAMINWYRANKRSLKVAQAAVTVPVLVIWGAKDDFLIQELAHVSMTKCIDGKLVILEDATHWLHHEQPEKVNKLILDFIR